MTITYSECVSVSVVIQHTKHMHRIIYIYIYIYNHIVPLYPINGTNFGKKLLKIKCAFSVSLRFFVSNTSHSKHNSEFELDCFHPAVDI